MRVLIAYATTEGQTRKICRFCADHLFAAGHSVEMLPAADADDLEPAAFDGAILAGSVHLGRVQEELAGFASAHAGALKSLFLQVSLAAAGDDPEELSALEGIAQAFCRSAGWNPDAIHHVAGAFRFTEYDFFRSWAMRYIAARKGQQVDPRADTEYTDWAGLAAILDGWAGTG